MVLSDGLALALALLVVALPLLLARWLLGRGSGADDPPADPPARRKCR